MYSSTAIIVSVTQTSNGQLEVVYRFPSMTAYGNGRPVPDRVEKHVFSAVDGRIKNTKVIAGTHIPAAHVPERFEFPPQEPDKDAN